MSINDFLSALLIKLGLKKSEKRKTQDAIEECKKRIRDLNDEMNNLVDKIGDLESNLKEVRAKYDNAQNEVIKKNYALQLRSLLNKLEKYKQDNILTAEKIAKAEALLRSLEQMLDNMEHPTGQDDIEDMTDILRDIAKEKEDERRALKKMEAANASLTGSEPELDNEDLEAQLNAALGISAPAAAAETKPEAEIEQEDDGAKEKVLDNA